MQDQFRAQTGKERQVRLDGPMILDNLDLVGVELHQYFGIDLADESLQRSWPWLRARIVGLATIEGTRFRQIVMDSN